MKPDDIKLLEETLVEQDLTVLMLEPRNLLDDCILGLGRRFHDTFLIYDQSCVIRQLEKDMGANTVGPDFDDPHTAAIEFFEFNTVGAWVGEATPAFLITEDE